MAKFQVELAGEWKDYTKTEDRILTRAFMAGYPTCQFSLRGTSYEYNFDRMVQKNLTTGKERKIRAPHCLQQPTKPIVPKGPTLSMLVPAGSPGTTIQIDHPKVKDAHIQVAVPKHARVGQPMLVPIPDVAVASNVSVVTAGVISVDSGMSNAAAHKDQREVLRVEAAHGTADNDNNEATIVAPLAGNGTNTKRGWSTRAKVAAGGAAVAALGGGAALAAVVATEASDGGEGPSTEAPAPVPFDDGLWCPTTGTYGDVAASEVGGDWAWEGDAADTVCDGGEDDVAEDFDIVDAEDDGEWAAEMCGYDDGFSGDGADAVGDFVVDLF